MHRRLLASSFRQRPHLLLALASVLAACSSPSHPPTLDECGTAGCADSDGGSGSTAPATSGLVAR